MIAGRSSRSTWPNTPVSIPHNRITTTVNVLATLIGMRTMGRIHDRLARRARCISAS
jgi:hypothetical protein